MADSTLMPADGHPEFSRRRLNGFFGLQLSMAVLFGFFETHDFFGLKYRKTSDMVEKGIRG